MSEQAAQYADSLDAVNRDFIEVVSNCSDEQWKQTSTSEGWSVGVIAHHAAEGHASFNQFLPVITSGSDNIPPVTLDMINAGNAQHAEKYASVGRPETLELLQQNGEILAQSLRGLSDEQLATTTKLFGGNPMTVAQIVEHVYVGHPAQHLASIRATLNGTAE
ncbi:MAG TPA: DinB family protein [Nitrolancea sp.]|jgi:uncharacterized damage-inducible protein DinB|nr:DinB family protein [Nitrolancea sp.]